MKPYAASTYSEKSATSAKSSRSFLSLVLTKDPDTLKRSVWQSIKGWAAWNGNNSKHYRNTSQLQPDDGSTITTTSSSSSSLKKDVTTEKSVAVVRPGILRKKRLRLRSDTEDVRVTFLEPSPVPRFRNTAPAPPPSPPLLQVVVPKTNTVKSLISDDFADTVFASKPKGTNDDSHQDWKLSRRLYFHPPFYRGQPLTFSLLNMVPDEHIIVFKFLTSNATVMEAAGKKLMERYFVRPSAGRIDASSDQQIMLFLNRVPGIGPSEALKDKILVRWAAVQRHTQVYAWVQALPESTRRKWLEMLVEQWPNQVIVRETKLKIRFL